MAEKVAKLGLALRVGVAGRTEFTVDVDGDEVTGSFLAPTTQDHEVAVSLEPIDTASFKLVVTSGSDHEEHEGLTLKRGRSNLATKVNAASKLIKLEDTG